MIPHTIAFKEEIQTGGEGKLGFVYRIISVTKLDEQLDFVVV